MPFHYSLFSSQFQCCTLKHVDGNTATDEAVWI